jgi:hypothetical protein
MKTCFARKMVFVKKKESWIRLRLASDGLGHTELRGLAYDLAEKFEDSHTFE